jgi:alkanesulfonate monooxygenase SsuD/methylene tetrahydromethanopterin reductase-like flavin-dependent oxidoreductase (luciferase family)
MDFTARGRRLDEQVELLRLLWGSSSVTFDGEFHSVSRAGICPLPDEPIPIWFGGAADVAIRRAARLGDGFTFARPDEYLKVPRVVELLKQAGRDPDSFGIEGRLVFDSTDPGGLLAQRKAWESAGATHLVLSTLQLGLGTAAAHIEAMREAAELLLP